MIYDFQFFCTAILLGVGLAMDAFSVSLANGLNDHGLQIYVALAKRLCNTEGDGEHHKTYRIIKRNDGKEYICKRTLRLVLTYYHKSSCRSCRSSHCAKDYRCLE